MDRGFGYGRPWVIRFFSCSNFCHFGCFFRCITVVFYTSLTVISVRQNPNSEADPVYHYSRSTILYKDYPTEDITIYITIWPLNISYNFILAQEIQVLKIWNQKCLSLKEHRYSTACPKWTGVDLGNIFHNLKFLHEKCLHVRFWSKFKKKKSIMVRSVLVHIAKN